LNISLIFISKTPISKIVGDKIAPWWYLENGFNIEYWNISAIEYTSKQLRAYFAGHPEYRFRFPNEKVFTSKQEIEKALLKTGKKVIFNYIDFSQQKNDYWLRRLFKKYGVKYFVGPRRTSELYDSTITNKFWKKIVDAIHNKDFFLKVKCSINNYTKEMLYKFTSSAYQKPVFVVSSGKLGRVEWKARTNTETILSVPSIDILWNNSINIVETYYCVFVDDGVFYSPDKAMFTEGKVSRTCSDKETYKKNICRVFDEIENRKKLKVIIAASGKYLYPNNDLFGGREIYYYKTNQLIQHSSLVIAHASSGVMQAVADMKPIILLLDKSFIPTKNQKIIKMGDFLNIKSIWSSDLDSSHIDNVAVNKSRNNQILKDYFCENGVAGDYRIMIKNKIIDTCEE